MISQIFVGLMLVQAPTSEVVTLKVGGKERQFAYYAPSKKSAHTPLIFGFHGHGGNSRSAARSFELHTQWPEAAVIYPQGLPTAGRTDPDGLKNGWQRSKGQSEDRDLKFFDAMMNWAKKEISFDTKRVYAMGHSNGGRMVYLLWEQRADVFAAFGPSGSPATLLDITKPKPVIHMMGAKDPLVSPANQRRTVEELKKMNGCASKSETFGRYGQKFKGKAGNDVWHWEHPGEHEFPKEALPFMVEFFKSKTLS